MILPLQYLRGIAALMVLVYHLKTQFSRIGYADYWPEWTVAGVDIFFVLSGFLMWAITADRPKNPLEFFMRRLARIAPLYWVVTSFVVLIMLAAPHLLLTGRFDLPNVLASYAFVGVTDAWGKFYPVVNAGWTLNIEMMFYLLMAVGLVWSRAVRGFFVASMLLAFTIVGHLLASESGWFRLYPTTLLIEFIYGILIAEVYRRGGVDRVDSLLAWVMISIGFVALSFGGPDEFRGFSFGIPASAVLLGFLALRRQAEVRPIAWLKYLGDASYSIYLTHQIVLSVAYQTWRLVWGPSNGSIFLFAVYALGASVLVGVLVHRRLELPLTGYFQDRVNARWQLGRARSA